MNIAVDLRPPAPEPKPGQVLARGVCRHLAALDFVTVEEFTPAQGLRVDVAALGPKGEFWIVECKSSRADLMSDNKWEGYLDYCDRYFWAVPDDFPLEIIPETGGFMVADGYGAEILRNAPETKMAAARRKMLTHRFARHAARRWMSARDPGHGLGLFG